LASLQWGFSGELSRCGFDRIKHEIMESDGRYRGRWHKRTLAPEGVLNEGVANGI
jgi:hypothetical protein